LSLSRSPAVGPCGIPPDPDADDDGADVEVAAVDVAACGEAAAVEVAGGVEVVAVEVTAGVGEAVAVEAAPLCEELAVFALWVFALWVFVLALRVAAGCEARVAVAVAVAGAAEALVTVEELEEPDPQPAAARQARTSPQLARHLIDPEMAVPISMLQFGLSDERSVWGLGSSAPGPPTDRTPARADPSRRAWFTFGSAGAVSAASGA
jgi:hypothetical protein